MTLTTTEGAEMLGFLRQQREQELAKNPVRYYKLTAPDGSARGDVLECHSSHAAQLNEERMWRYLNSQRQRESDRLAREAKRRDEARIERYLAETAEDLARKAATQDIPLPAAKGEWAANQQQALLESRNSLRPLHRHNPTKAEPEPEPAIVWNSDDYLWQRVSHPSGPVVRVEGTLRCIHD